MLQFCITIKTVLQREKRLNRLVIVDTFDCFHYSELVQSSSKQLDVVNSKTALDILNNIQLVHQCTLLLITSVHFQDDSLKDFQLIEMTQGNFTITS